MRDPVKSAAFVGKTIASTRYEDDEDRVVFVFTDGTSAACQVYYWERGRAGLEVDLLNDNPTGSTKP